MRIEITRRVEMQDAGKTRRLCAGEIVADLPAPVAQGLVSQGYATWARREAELKPVPERVTRRRK